MLVDAQRALLPEHTGSVAVRTVEAAVVALETSAGHTALPVPDKEEGRFDWAHTCYRMGLAELAGFVQHTGSFAYLHMQHSGLLELVVRQVLAAAVEHVAWPCPQSAVVPVHRERGSDSSLISGSSVVRRDR